MPVNASRATCGNGGKPEVISLAGELADVVHDIDIVPLRRKVMSRELMA